MQGTSATGFIYSFVSWTMKTQLWATHAAIWRGEMKNSVRHIIASGFLLSLFWAGVCVLQAQQSGSATVEQNPKFQPQLVTKTVSVINPPARGSVTTTLKGTELAPNASGQAKLKMGEMEVTIEAQANGLAAPGSFGAQMKST